MTREEAETAVYKKYDMEVLKDILRYSDKCPSAFDWDNSKLEVDFDDIEEALILKELGENNIL
jgi:hypothetical protein